MTSNPSETLLEPYALALPAHFPPFPHPVPSQAKADLGRLLFHDFRLSVDDARSCGICHEGKKGYTDGFVVAVGALGDAHTRNTLSLLNLAWRGPLTWVDPSLEDPVEQMQVPLFGRHPVEMGTDPSTLPDKLAGIDVYPPAFAAAWPDDPSPITMTHVEDALAAYELLIVAGNTPYDRYLLGEHEAMSADQKAGMELFYSERTGCGGCHGGLFFDRPATADGTPTSDRPEYLNTGLYNIDGAGGLPPNETGLHALTGDQEDMGRFRVPSLRGVAETGPWGHDGSYGALADIVDDYARGGRLLVGGPWPGDGRDSPWKDPRITGFSLSATEHAQLVAFLEALTDVEANARPFLQTPFCAEELDSGHLDCIPVEP
ncbi:MAG TPA: di-heme enzyme [Deltaproteobacteria bacterium]|nr:di-heme enzyme [Deltaproteobacteria bacterium]